MINGKMVILNGNTYYLTYETSHTVSEQGFTK